MATAQSTVVSPRWQQPTWAEQRWPETASARWLLRLVLALPFAGFALYAERAGFVDPFDAQLAGGAYPPLPGLIAAVMPGGALGVGLVASGTAGVVLAALSERLVRREVPRWLRAPLLLPLFLVPAVVFAGSQNLTGLLTVAFLGLALAGFIRFAIGGAADGAFFAGLMLACAALCAPVALVWAVALGFATPYVAATRRPVSSDATRATWAVLMFPALAAVAGWAVLEWRLTGRAFGTLAADPLAFAFAEGVLGQAGQAFTTAASAVAHAPLYLAAGVVYAVRRPRALAAYAVPVLGLLVTVFFGLPYSGVTSYLLLTVVALVAVPRAPGRRLGVFLTVAGLTQWLLALLWPPTGPAFQEWLTIVWGG